MAGRYCRRPGDDRSGYAAAEAILRDAYLRTEHVDTGNLVRRGFVVVNPDGHHTAIIPFR